MLGGDDNFTADKDIRRELLDAAPGLGEMLREERRWRRKVIQWLVGQTESPRSSTAVPNSLTCVGALRTRSLDKPTLTCESSISRLTRFWPPTPEVLLAENDQIAVSTVDPSRPATCGPMTTSCAAWTPTCPSRSCTDAPCTISPTTASSEGRRRNDRRSRVGLLHRHQPPLPTRRGPATSHEGRDATAGHG